MQDKSVTVKAERICALVVTFNRKILLEECLTALLSQTWRLDEIVVIDNASTDGTDELIKSKFAGITYVKLTDNIGGAGGFYEGMKLAYDKGHDWIWVMDDDSISLPDALEKLLHCPLRLNNRVYALASAVLKRDGTVFLAHRRLFNAKEMTESIVDAGKYEQGYFEMDTASFVGFLISRKAIDEIGFPLREMFIYFDDTEYSLRIRKKGIMLTVTTSKVLHGDPTKIIENSAWGEHPSGWKKYYCIRNRIYTYRKYGKNSFALYVSLFWMTRDDIWATLRSGQARAYNIRLSLCATFDGLLGRLGKNAHFLPS